MIRHSYATYDTCFVQSIDSLSRCQYTNTQCNFTYVSTINHKRDKK